MVVLGLKLATSRVVRGAEDGDAPCACRRSGYYWQFFSCARTLLQDSCIQFNVSTLCACIQHYNSCMYSSAVSIVSRRWRSFILTMLSSNAAPGNVAECRVIRDVVSRSSECKGISRVQGRASRENQVVNNFKPYVMATNLNSFETRFF